ncbi:phosphonate degradation HD-domain oxygenase [Frigoriglobus tundricola]|uniref:HD phosphohydrolase-like protein n=1 Tax=Frigoriglobus tundricola TaxID=2774151 RepID=A0A6M5YKM3_9BACT|nr:phosphonate degradation HD-domain oxygenase [Frigoriglobus tundricola]QJW94518.1 HD phosphohydrolase-like protein [Frigoriglobus tundricola]
MTPGDVLARAGRLFAERGGAEYHGEAVTQLEHALQCAALAERDGRPAAWVVAALLHDVGHLLHGHGEAHLADGIDDDHEELGARFLARAFGPAVTEPIRMHVPAKRYLCAARAGYREGLSPASVRSLELQGGPMTAAEAAAFEAHPHFAAAVQLREYDDRAKVVGLATPPFDHFLTYLERCLRADRSA